MTCAKTTVRCTLVTASGEHIVGTNLCRNPQPTCPRLPGDDYVKCTTVCDQAGHAEIVAVRLAGSKAAGARAYIEGHTYACMACQHALFGAGIISLSIGAPPDRELRAASPDRAALVEMSGPDAEETTRLRARAASLTTEQLHFEARRGLFSENGTQSWYESFVAIDRLASLPSPAEPQVPVGWKLVRTPITEDMHVAAVKVLHRASGVDGLPQRMVDAMLAAAPSATTAAPVQAEPACMRHPDGAINVAMLGCGASPGTARDAGSDTERLDWLLPNLHPATWGMEFPGGHEWADDAEFRAKWRAAIDSELDAARAGAKGDGDGPR